MFNLAGALSNLVSYDLILGLGTEGSVIHTQELEVCSKPFHRLWS